MSKDLARRLKAADPAARLDLRADDAMRETIMTTHVTTTTDQRVVRARRIRRGLISGGLATALVGGGAAYAAFDQWFDWYRGGGGNDGLTCMARWNAPEDERSGGPWLTGDAVADCQRYQELTGLALIEDPVAFQVDGDLATFVTARGEVPDGATLVAADPDDLAVQELDSSLSDYVDGLGAQCLDEAGAVAAARAELDRLGLDDWTVQVQARPAGWPEGECSEISYLLDLPASSATSDPTLPDPGVVPDPVAGQAPTAAASTPEPWPSISAPQPATPAPQPAASAPQPTADTTVPQGDGLVPRTLAVYPRSAVPRDSLRGDVVDFVFDLRDTLRTQVADACVDLDEAERIATEAIGDEHHWPTVVVEDPAAECTRVDLVVGGSLQVSLRGPRS